MNNDLCPRDCKYLSHTEHDQNTSDQSVLHKCLKYDIRLFRLLAHPDLYKCDQCFKENEDVNDI